MDPRILDSHRDALPSDDAASLKVPVRRVIPDRAPLPRLAIVSLVVGAITFLAGIEIGGVPGRGPSAAASSPTPSPTASPVATPRRVRPGSSAVAQSLKPIEIVQAVRGKSKCDGQDLGSIEGDGPVVPEEAFVHVWRLTCPIAPATDETFASDLVLRMMSATGASSASSGFANDTGTCVILVAYATEGVEGTVTIAMTPAATTHDLELTITLEERSAP